MVYGFPWLYGVGLFFALVKQVSHITKGKNPWLALSLKWCCILALCLHLLFYKRYVNGVLAAYVAGFVLSAMGFFVFSFFRRVRK